MRILFVAPRLPLPADTGAKIRTFNLLKNIAQGNEVTLVSFYFSDDEKSVEALRLLGIEVHLVKASERINPFTLFGAFPVAIAKYRSKAMAEKISELVANGSFDVVHFDHLHMGQYRGCAGTVPSVLDEHNVESIILGRCSLLEKSYLRRLLFRSQARKMAQFEANTIKNFSTCFAVSENDKEGLLKLSAGKAKVEVIPNGVDTEYFKNEIALEQGTLSCSTQNRLVSLENVPVSLVFTGSMDWLPNSEAVLYFAREILPLIWAKNDTVKFYVVGRNPSKEIVNLGKADARIVVTGLVPDVRAYMVGAHVFVVPIRVGGGTRLKILEAMSMGLPIVSTTVGAEGISYTNGKDIVLSDTPAEFAANVLILLEEDGRCGSLGNAARDLVCRKYDWKALVQRLNEIYEKVVTDAHK